MDYFKKYSPFVNLLLLFIVVNVVLRIVLLFHPITQSSFGILEIVEIFGFGLLSDVFVFVVASAFLWLYLLCFFMPDPFKTRYHRRVSQMWMSSKTIRI